MESPSSYDAHEALSTPNHAAQRRGRDCDEFRPDGGIMREQVHVLHVTESLAHGGAEQNLLSIARRLPRNRFRQHLAWLYDHTELLEAFRPHVDQLVPLGVRGGRDLPRAAYALARWIRRERPDVIHAQLIAAQLVARTAAFFGRRCPVITTWQNAFYDDSALADFGGSRVRRELVRSLDRLTGRFDRHFIAVSEYVAAECGRKLGVRRDRVSVIHNAVDPERYGPVDPLAVTSVRRELGLAHDARVLLTVGRLVPQKAHADLIAAMPAVIARVPRAVLLIAGKGPLEQALRAQIVTLGLADSIRLLGARRDVALLYQLADVFAFPSRWEGLSVALVEALANGLPAVLSDIPQNREVADGLGSVRFVPPGGVAGFADALLELLSDHDIARREAMSSRDTLREQFAPDRLALRFAEAIERAAGRSA